MSMVKGFFEVDLAQVKRPGLDPDWQRSQHGTSRQDIDTWTRQLGEIQRLSVERGFNYEDFNRMRGSAIPEEHALGVTHHKFYDNDGSHRDFVKLSWNGKEYEVDGGRHRVESAQRIGLRRMPAEVSASSEQMAQRKQDGFSSKLMHPNDRADFERSERSSVQQSHTREASNSAPAVPGRGNPGGVLGRVSR